MKAQSARSSEHNLTAWGTLNIDWNLDKNIALHLDLNERRVNATERIFQHLYRMGVNYKVNNNLSFRAGYVLARTSPYGETQQALQHQTATEHRSFQSATFTNRSGNLEISHRIILEQRWNGKFSSQALTRQDSWAYFNRARYRIRFNYSLRKSPGQQAFPYVFLYDELMVHFGRQVRENIFDQNRTGFFLGYNLNKHLRAETGYTYQAFQLSREYDNKNVFQYNSNLMLNLLVNIHSKKAAL